METETMTFQIHVELYNAFMQAVTEDGRPVENIVHELIQNFIEFIEEKKTPLYRGNELLAVGKHDEAIEVFKELPVPPELADAFKEIYGVEFLIREGFNLSKVEEEYGREWFTK